jgi:RNA polymerase sigma factor (sigma-70 family)
MTALPDWATVSDGALATAAVAGDRDAFAAIYDRYADRLHDFCVGMLRNRDSAADCVQDVFCIASTRLGQLKDPERLRPWLYSVARNEALRCIREGGRERVYDEVPDLASDEPGPDIMAARAELADLVAEAAGGLSDRDRAVLELTYRHGMDGPELAEALDVSHASAKKMMQRLRETIEKSLGALLVSRRAVENPNNCPALDEILTGWDGEFTVLMRKRIARHIESCPVCDEDRRRMVSPAALLGAAPAFIPAPGWLRARTLDRIQLPAVGQGGSAATQSGREPDGHSGGSPRPQRRRGHRAVIGAAILAAIGAAGLGLSTAWMLERNPDVHPADLTNKVTQSSAPIPQSPNEVEHSPAVRLAPASTEAPLGSAPSAQTTPATPLPAVPTQTSTQTVPTQTVNTLTTTATVTTTQIFPVRPPTVASEPPTFTAPPSQNSTMTTSPPATVVKPPRPIRGPGTVLRPIPVTTTAPVIQ